MILRRTAAYLWPYRWRVPGALAPVALTSGLALLKPWPPAGAVESGPGGEAGFWAPLARVAPALLLTVSAAALVATYALLGIVSVWNNYTTISIGQGMVNDLRSRIYAHLQRLSLSFHNRASVGDLIYRVTADTYAIQTLAMNG